jgi:MiaB/RimO family radical SAM methylthiotransferase
MKSKIYIKTLGCLENTVESGIFRRYFQLNNWTVVSKIKDANVVLINSCGFKKAAVENSIREIKRIQSQISLSTRGIICGCLTQINPYEIKKHFGDRFEVVVKEDFDRLFDSRHPLNTIKDFNEMEYDFDSLQMYWMCRKTLKPFVKFAISIYSPYFQGFNSNIGILKIASGCVGKCTYCSIRKARGRLCSEPIDSILANFRGLLERGFKTIVISATDSGSYGKDKGTTIAHLLREMIKYKGKYKLIIRNFEPMALRPNLPELLPVFKSGRIAAITIPIQSGSQKVINRMKRDYNISQLSIDLKTIRKCDPRIVIFTHLIIGFPGEDEADFQATKKLLNTVSMSQ